MNLLEESTEEIVNIVCGCSTSSVDWSQFWPSMIATFVGFVLALIGAFITGFASKKIKIRKLRKRVFCELAQLYIDITENDDSGLTYDYPIWDSVISASLLLDIGDNKFLLELSNLYGQLKILAEYEGEQSKTADINSKPAQNILDRRKEVALAIKSSIYFNEIQKAEKILKKNGVKTGENNNAKEETLS